MIRQLREQNLKEEEDKRVAAQCSNLEGVRRTDPQCAKLDLSRTMRNPVLPHAPEGFGDFDFTQSETRARQLYYASDEWADIRDADGQAIFVEEEDQGQAEGPETWYRTQDRPLPPNIEQFALNWLVINAEMKGWESGILRALEILIAEGAKKMSQTALAELTVRQNEMHNRTGELPPGISWAAVTDMGDVSAHQLRIGGLEFIVLDYGDRPNIPTKLRMLLNEWNTLEKNQCSIIHLAAGIEWHLQKRPSRFPLKARVINLAAELRIHEYTREGEIYRHYTEEGNEADRNEILKALCRDVVTANHDRDFRFLPLFSGGEVGDHQLPYELRN